jgi:hypothetical protein
MKKWKKYWKVIEYILNWKNMPKRTFKTNETEWVEKYRKNEDFVLIPCDDRFELMNFRWKNGSVFFEEMKM